MNKIYMLALAALFVTACTPQQSNDVADVMMGDTASGTMLAGEDLQPSEMQQKMQGMQPSTDRMMHEDATVDFSTAEYEYVGQLQDITDGAEVRNFSTGGAATGVAKAAFIDGEYVLEVTFENLPNPVGRDFYEGWVVRKSPFDVISTGKIEKIGDQFVNRYTSGQDLRPYDFYVLTIEPDDKDSAPADHILEGTLIRQ